MNLNITGHHVDLTDAMRNYVIDKLGRIERHSDDMIDANVILTVEKSGHKAEATLHARGANLHAEATCENMYSAIDKLVDKLDRQTSKYKEKLKDHHAREGLKMAADAGEL
ncbi:MAG: ribosome-associated translation inhibitor RaiA [Oceanococcaceae bacterium]